MGKYSDGRIFNRTVNNYYISKYLHREEHEYKNITCDEIKKLFKEHEVVESYKVRPQNVTPPSAGSLIIFM